MIVRKLTKEDKFEAAKISLYCFHERVEDIEKVKERSLHDESEDWGAFNENNQLMAHIINNHFICNLNGIEVMNGGIGAVSTLPEYRESGAIRTIFQELLKECFKRGEVVSTLFPFNPTFYAKFGYDVVCFKNIYQLKAKDLKCYQFNGEIKQYVDGDDFSDYCNLYEEFSKNYNLSIKRSPEHMKYAFLGKSPFKNRKFAYQFRQNNEAIAYLLMDDVYNKEAAILKAKELVWKNKEGFYAILNFLSRFSADYGKIEISLPSNIELFSILKTENIYNVDKETENSYMVRVINAKKALETIDYQDYQFAIKVKDEIIEENNKIFLVSKNGVLESKDDEYDIECSINALSLIISGAISLDEASLREDVIILNQEKNLKRIFVRKNIFVHECF